MITDQYNTLQEVEILKYETKDCTYPQIRLKGGSLSETTLHVPPSGMPFVRKQVSIKTNREYGFQRWYSQLKRLQRYEYMYPGRYPKILDYGCSAANAYFDMEYIEDSTNVYEFLKTNKNTDQIGLLFDNLTGAMADIHKVSLPSFESALPLYIHEEISQRLKDCMSNSHFRLLTGHKYIYFQNLYVEGIYTRLGEYKDLFLKHYKNPSENFSHGNMTLENILYQSKTGRIVFIDPYEENVIDSKLADYSQIMQSCDALYELYNENDTTYKDNRISANVDQIPEGLILFKNIFLDFLKKELSSEQYVVVRLLQVSQFIRMLPFKMAIDTSKMMFFYGLASYLFDKITLDLKNGNRGCGSN